MFSFLGNDFTTGNKKRFFTINERVSRSFEIQASFTMIDSTYEKRCEVLSEGQPSCSSFSRALDAVVVARTELGGKEN
jgi:hypothetical protein